MSTTMSTVISIIVIIVSISYPIFYWRKKKHNSHLQIGYKITFAVIFIFLFAVVFNLLL